MLRYFKGTINLDLLFYLSGSLYLECFSNADWAIDRDDERLVASYYVYLGPNLVSWCFKKQSVVFRSNNESEYSALAIVASKCSRLDPYLLNLLFLLDLSMLFGIITKVP